MPLGTPYRISYTYEGKAHNYHYPPDFIGTICDGGLLIAKVALAARSADTLHTIINELHEHHREAIAVPTDMHNKDAIEALVDRVFQQYGQIDILINNTGIDCRIGTIHSLLKKEKTIPVPKKQSTTPTESSSSQHQVQQSFHQRLREHIRDATRVVMEEIMSEELTQFLGAKSGRSGTNAL